MFAGYAGRVSAVVLSALVAVGCGGADEATPLTVRLENLARFTQLKSGVYNTRMGSTTPGPLAPGDAFEFSFTAGNGQKLAFASMLGQSNDWVFAPAPGGIELYSNGVPISGDITSSIYLWDVGTELDEEPGVGAHTGPNQASSKDGPGPADPNPLVRQVPLKTTLSSGKQFFMPAVSSMLRVTVRSDAATRMFTVRIQNVANDGYTLQTSQGPKPVRVSPGVWTLSTGGEPLFSEGKKDRALGLEALAESGQVNELSSSLASTTGTGTPVSPGIFLVHQGQASLFTVGAPDRNEGLERIAEDGNVAPLAEALQSLLPADVMSGVFNTPEGAANPGAARPGSAYTFQVSARPGDRLSLVTMFGMSNDWFFGTTPEGIELFNADGDPRTGDMSSELRLYDVGTELSEEPGIGPNTGPQQPAPNTGRVDLDGKVREVTPAAYATPVTQHLKLTISR
jgi:hypothetical protein